MRRKHRARLERTPRTRATLGPRDLELFRLLFDTFRVATAQELAPLVPEFFPSHFVLQRRLRRLFDAGYLARPPGQDLVKHGRAGTPPTLYALGNKGAGALRDAGLAVAKTDFDQDARDLKPLSLAHMHATSAIVADFLVALRARVDVHVTRVLRDGELRVRVTYPERGRTVRGSVQPDTTLVIEERGKPCTALLLEVDRHTMPLTRTNAAQSYFLKKCRAYYAWWQDAALMRTTIEATDFLVLTIAPTPAHAEALRQVAKLADPKHQGTDIFWFTSADALSVETALTGAIWSTAADRTGPLLDPV